MCILRSITTTFWDFAQETWRNTHFTWCKLFVKYITFFTRSGFSRWKREQEMASFGVCWLLVREPRAKSQEPRGEQARARQYGLLLSISCYCRPTIYGSSSVLSSPATHVGPSQGLNIAFCLCLINIATTATSPSRFPQKLILARLLR